LQQLQTCKTTAFKQIGLHHRRKLKRKFTNDKQRFGAKKDGVFRVRICKYNLALAATIAQTL
jgi:hypothetical protein